MTQRPIYETGSGLVVNVIEIEDGAEFQAPDGHEIGPAGGHIGQTWTGSAYTWPPLPAPTKADLKAYAGAKRWQVETMGVTVGGNAFPTDTGTRAALAQTIQSIDLGIISAPINWKLPSGSFVALDRAGLLTAAQDIANHVQLCFDCEEGLVSAIDAGSVTTFAAIDAAAWPS